MADDHQTVAFLISDRDLSEHAISPCDYSGMNAATPWWGTLLVAGISLVGILVSQWLTLRRDVLAREEQRKLSRVDVYADFNHAVVKLVEAIQRKQEEDKIIQLAHAVVRKYFPLIIVAPKTVKNVAAQLAIEADAVGSVPLSDAEMERLDTAFTDLASALMLAMKADVHGQRVGWIYRSAGWVSHPVLSWRASRARAADKWERLVSALDAEAEKRPVPKNPAGPEVAQKLHEPGVQAP